jgi:hypothetical protein
VIIRFTQKVELEFSVSYDTDTKESLESYSDIFDVGNVLEIDLIEDNGDSIDAALKDGCVIYSLPKHLYEIIKD